MAVTTIHCLFCHQPIEVPGGVILEKCPLCQKKLHHFPGAMGKSSKNDSPDESSTVAVGAEGSKAKSDLLKKEKAATLKSLGPYQIVRSIGQGGMGFVYEALDTRLNRPVALKTLETGMNEYLLERFREEARNAARLKHPNIVAIHDVGRENGFDYFTMELVNGMTLDKWLHEKKRDLREKIRIMEIVARALHYSHQQGVIHRDVKPGNIMIDHKGDVLVMDFGLARNVKDSQNLTLSGAIMGTPAYMAPEQAMGGGANVGSGVDVWGMGVVLYEILTGKLPFDNGNVYQSIYSVLHDEPASIQKIDASLPGELDWIVMKCLEKQIQQRYSTAENLADDLKAWLEDRPLSVRPMSWWEIFKKKIRRTRAISMDEFMREHQVRQRLESEHVELKTRLESESRQEWNLVFEEDFMDLDLESRWEIVGGDWKVLDSELKIWGGRPQILYLKKPIAGDVRIEFSCRQEGSWLCDMSCFMSTLPIKNRRRACDSGYMFQLGGHGNTQTFLEKAGEILWKKMESPIVQGVDYRICAQRQGGLFSFWVNDRLVFEVRDPEPLSSSKHATVGFYGWVSTTYYGKVRIYRLGAPLKADILELAERQFGKGNYDSARELFQEVMDSSEDRLRIQQAAQGIKMIEKRMALDEMLPVYQKKLAEHWPQAKLEITNEGVEFHFSGQNLTDLEPLRGIPLVHLECSKNQVQNLESLRGMPLNVLNVSQNKISSLKPIQGMNLVELRCDGNPLENLEGIQGMPLRKLNCSNTGIRDLSLLNGDHLEELLCEDNPGLDPSSISGNSIQRLFIAECQLRSLEPMRNFRKLKILRISKNQITSLAPLKGLHINILNCYENLLETLEPLVEDPPLNFDFDCETLPCSELMRVSEIWGRNPQLAELARNALVLAIIKRKAFPELKSLGLEFHGNRYLLIPRHMSWENAREFSLMVGGDLFVPENEPEMDFFKSFFLASFRVWIGIKADGDEPKWLDGGRVNRSDGLFYPTQRKSNRGAWGRGRISMINGVDGVKLPFVVKWKK